MSWFIKQSQIVTKVHALVSNGSLFFFVPRRSCTRLHHSTPGMKHFFIFAPFILRVLHFDKNLGILWFFFCSYWVEIKCVTPGTRFQVQVVTDGGVWGSKNRLWKHSAGLTWLKEASVQHFHFIQLLRKEPSFSFFWLLVLPKLTLLSKHHSLACVCVFSLRHFKCFWPEGCMLHCCWARPAHWKTVAT